MGAWKVKPTNADEVLPKKAIEILRELENAVNSKQRRRYNKILKKLRAEYPDKAALIESHFIAPDPVNEDVKLFNEKVGKKALLKKTMRLSPEEKEWIRNWKEIRGV